MIYAPILITTLNRFECLKTCIESLKNNSWAKYTELYISVDYPPSERYKKGNDDIKQYLKQGIKGFKKVNIYYQKSNLGALNNIEWLRKVVCKSHDRYIFLEDDNELAPGFIEFCDRGLDLFENDDSVFALNGTDYVWCGNGYTPPIRKAKKNSNNIEKRQLIYHATAYWEFKRKKVISFCNELSEKHRIYNYKELFKLHKKSPYFFYQYISMVALQHKKLPWFEGKLYPIDFMADIYMLLYDKYVISPIEPLQRDLGVDGNGINYNEKFSNADALKKRELCKVDGFEFVIEGKLKINEKEIELHNSNMKLTILSKLIILIKFITNYFYEF